MQPTPLTLRDKMEDTLYILSITANRNYHLLENCVQVHIDTNDNPTEPEQTLISGVKMFTSIQFSAFLDEWEQHFLKLKEDTTVTARIERVERLVQPAFDVIALYPNIKDFRDTFLAHNARIRVTRTVYENSYRGNYVSTLVVPASLSEFMLVATAFLEISKTIIEEFKDYYIQPEDFLEKYTTPNNIKPKTNQECFDLDTEMKLKIDALRQSENH
jgi:hypothetical protein